MLQWHCELEVEITGMISTLKQIKSKPSARQITEIREVIYFWMKGKE